MWVADNGRENGNGPLGGTSGDDAVFGARDAEAFGQEQLTLADEDEQLPWLEADDDHEEPGPDTARLVMLAVVGLLAILGLVGAIWWSTRDSDDDSEAAQVAQGGTIEAPDAPYKTRPADPGGAQVAGTGDVSFEVGEGKTREGVVAGAVPRPSIDRAQGSSETGETPKPAATASTPSTAGGVGVQVGAYSTQEGAQQGWSVLSGRLSALSGVSHRIVTGTVDGGTIYRLQAVAGSVESAEALCRSIRSQGGDCQVKR